jgi:uncharacterized C2H2 Zn-finger protein
MRYVAVEEKRQEDKLRDLANFQVSRSSPSHCQPLLVATPVPTTLIFINYLQLTMHATRNLRVRNAHSAHSSAPRLSCPVQGCSAFFLNRSGLTNHLRRSHTSDAKPATEEFHIPLPGEEASREGSSQPGPLPGSQSDGLRLHCPDCNRKFRNQASLTTHIRAEHPLPVKEIGHRQGGPQRVLSTVFINWEHPEQCAPCTS